MGLEVSGKTVLSLVSYCTFGFAFYYPKHTRWQNVCRKPQQSITIPYSIGRDCLNRGLVVGDKGGWCRENPLGQLSIDLCTANEPEARAPARRVGRREAGNGGDTLAGLPVHYPSKYQ